MKNLIYLLSIVYCLSLIQCSNDSANNSTAPSSKNNILVNGMSISVPSGITGDDILGRIVASNDKFYDLIGDFKQTSKVLGLFYNDNSDWAIDAGSLTMNSQVIDRAANSTDGGYPDSTVSYLSNISVPINQSSYTFSATGSSWFSSFSFSLFAPASEVSLNNISHNQSVSKNDSLIVTWNCTHDTSHCVRISISDIDANQKTYYVDDTGTFTIPKDDMDDLSNGEASFRIMLGTYKLHDLGSNKYVLAMILSTESIKIDITN